MKLVSSTLITPYLSLLLTIAREQCVHSFTLPSYTNYLNVGQSSSSSNKGTQTQLLAKKQTGSSLIRVPNENKTKPEQGKKDDTESNEEIFGTKFFGGSAIKEELFDAGLEAQADKLQKLYPPKQNKADEQDVDTMTYRRFMDTNAFPDEKARILAQRLQSVINQVLYISNDDGASIGKSIYSSNLKWDTPFSKDASSRIPLDELTNALDFYKRMDLSIISAKSLSDDNSKNVQQVEIKWEISLLWPNVFESRVLITGSSILTVDSSSSDDGTPTILSQTDFLDQGGKDGKDIIQAISAQLQPRFWDLYHIGMTPSAELMPRLAPQKQSKGLFSAYDLFEIPSRLVLQPTVIDTGGRATREAESIPNHAFSSIIKTTGPTAQRYITTSPVEVAIRRTSSEGKSKSIISWNIALPPEYVSYYDEMSLLVSDEDKEIGNEPTVSYVFQPRRLVATIKYGGSAQDSEVTDIRKKLYDQVIKDGLKPKLGEDGRPQFFFLQNDTKACFTGDGGLGMAVYEWRPKSSDPNEVGIELEV